LVIATLLKYVAWRIACEVLEVADHEEAELMGYAHPRPLGRKPLDIERHLETRNPAKELGSNAHLGYKPAFILTKAQSVKFCPGEAAAVAGETTNFLDAAAWNSSQRSVMKPQR
jgi:hypothetical protein